jgi:RNA polymerase sigma-70 factor (ECF subfamily)
MGYREIAGIMDCPVDTVKTRMFHARRHLKRRRAGELPEWL